MDKQQQQAAQKAEAEKREKEARNTMLTQILTQEAMARLNSIAVVKPDNARMIENVLIDLARRGGITSKMQEEDLVNLIKNMHKNQPESKQSKITIIRKRQTMDSDEE